MRPLTRPATAYPRGLTAGVATEEATHQLPVRRPREKADPMRPSRVIVL